MRVVAVILSLLTIFLSSYPCCQESDNCSDTFATWDSSENESGDDNHEKEPPCSPFFSCGRCSGFTLTYDGLLDIVSKEILVKSNTEYYQELNPKEFYFHAFKPPRYFEV